MKRLIFILLLLPILGLSQTNYYLATDGDDSNDGTSISTPWGTWKRALPRLTAGDTLFVRGGVYQNDTVIIINPGVGIGASGTAGNPIVVMGYPDDVNSLTDTTWQIVRGDTITYSLGNMPVIDSRSQRDSIIDPGWNVYNATLNFNRTAYWVLKDFHVCHSYQYDSVNTGVIAGSECVNFTFDHITIYDASNRGYWWTSGAWNYADSIFAVDYYGVTPSSASPPFEQPDTTYWINCDVHDICDTMSPDPGNAGDCWKVVNYWGNYMEWNGCRGWYYSDDCIDPNFGQRRWYDCWAYSSGKYKDIGPEWDTENNGMKSTSYDYEYFNCYTPEDSALFVNDSLSIWKNCFAMYCDGSGFISNLASDTSANGRFYNCTAIFNGINFSIGAGGDSLSDWLYNNIAFQATSNNACGYPYNISTGYNLYKSITNSFISNGYCNSDNPIFNIDSSDFVTLDSLWLDEKFRQARPIDRTLTFDSVPGMLASGSSMIDGGTDGYWVNTYAGTAPDVGFYEYGGDSIPVAAFSGDDVTIFEGESVTFTDASTLDPTSWSWSFAGGTPSTSSDQNPTITYNTAGTYTVSLTATNEWGSDTETKTNYITVDVQPSGEFPPLSQEKKILIRVR